MKHNLPDKMSQSRRRAASKMGADEIPAKKRSVLTKESAGTKINKNSTQPNLGQKVEMSPKDKSTLGNRMVRLPKQTAGSELNKAMKQVVLKGKLPKGAKGKILKTQSNTGDKAADATSEVTEPVMDVTVEETAGEEYTVQIVPPQLAVVQAQMPRENGEASNVEEQTERPMRGDYDINELMGNALAVSHNGTSKEEGGQKRSYKREFNIPCAYCEVMLKDYGYLFRHVTRIHKNEPDVDEYLNEIRPRMRATCPICKKTVSSASNVSAHIKQCHADEECSVQCPLCNKHYKTQISLKQHLRQCHQPQVRKHKCPHCDMTFTENRSLREHINCTHETTQIFRCDDCGKTFLTKGRLRRHKYIHSDFRHYCSYCSKGFHLKDNMNKHVEIMHEKKLGKRFQCPHCTKSFTVKGNMKQHIMGVHLRQYAYSCPICGEGYRRKKDMLLHMEQHKEGMSTLKIEDVKIDPHTIKLPPPSVKVQMAPTDGCTTGTTVIEVLPQNIKVLTE